jgi:V/A-type H+-transporting ATPase subunit C
VSHDFTYVVARLRAIEAYRPDKVWYQRLARTSKSGMLGMLREYFSGFETVDSLFDFESGIEAEKNAALRLISGLISDDGTRIFLHAAYDFDNLLHAWKAQRLGRTPAPNPFGTVTREDIEKAVSGGSAGELPAHLGALLERLEALPDDAGLAQAEYLGEAEKWRFLIHAAPGREAIRYVKTMIDVINIKTFIRLKRSTLRKQALDTVWIDGGRIEPARLAALFREPEEGLYSYMETTSYRKLAQRGLSKDTALWKIDPILRLELLEQLGESRYRFFDLSPVLFHIETLERDMQLLRTIIVGRINNLPEESVGEHIDMLLPA